MSSNFDFVPKSEEWKKLRTLVKHAEENVYYDPDTTCVKARKALEFVVEYIYENRLDKETDRELFNLLTDDKFERWLRDVGGHPLENIFHEIRSVGNDGAHLDDLYKAEVGKEESLRILKATHKMVWWFMQRNAPAHTSRDSSDFEVPEEKDTDVAPTESSSQSRVQRVEELREWSTSELIHLVKTEASDSSDVEIATGILLNRIKQANHELIGFLS